MGWFVPLKDRIKDRRFSAACCGESSKLPEKLEFKLWSKIIKVYTYSEARKRFAEILNMAREEDVIIQRRGGETFTIAFKKTSRSPFAIPGIKTKADTTDILQAIKDSREIIAEPINPPNARSSRR